MYFSKANLMVVEVASSDTQQDSTITGVHINADGSTVATDGHTMLVVGPAREELEQFPDVGPPASIKAGGITVDAEVVKQALKNLPKDVVMQYAALTEGPPGEIEFTTVDKRKRQRVSGDLIRGQYPDWLRLARGAREHTPRARVAINRRKLINLLKTMDAACPDRGGDNLVFIEIGEEKNVVTLRTVNYATGQNALGMLMPIDMQKQWLEDSEWEARITREQGEGARGRRIK